MPSSTFMTRKTIGMTIIRREDTGDQTAGKPHAHYDPLINAQKIGQHFPDMLPKIREWTKKEYE
mgnify:CR=1 FL=1